MPSDRTTHIAVADAGPHVEDVMLAPADTFPSTATVADARRAFESPRHKLLVVVDGPRYVGSVLRESVEGVDDATPLADVAVADVPTVAPDDPTATATDLDMSRTPVVDAQGEFRGLVCFNRTRGSFCVMKN